MGSCSRINISDLEVLINENSSFGTPALFHGRAIRYVLSVVPGTSTLYHMIKMVFSLEISIIMSVNIDFHFVFNEEIISVDLRFFAEIRQKGIPGDESQAFRLVVRISLHHVVVVVYYFSHGFNSDRSTSNH